MLRYARAPLVCLLAGLLLTACNGGVPDATTLIVGVTSDYRGGVDIDQLRVRMTVDGETLADDDRAVTADTFPAEFSFEDVAPGTPLSITLRGMLGGSPRVVRHMRTEAGPPNARRLVRVHLERLCDLAPSSSIPPAPSCDENTQTCISGTCRSAEVPVDQQRTYEPDWAEGSDDACEPGGAPEIVVGKGQSDYFDAEDYEVAQVEAGPQGGHHIWVAARLRNLKRSGSVTTVGGEIPSLGLSISPLKVIFTFDVDEGGYCKIFGLRFQLDVGDQAIEPMLGEEIQVHVTIEDPDGDQATDTHWFTLSETID